MNSDIILKLPSQPTSETAEKDMIMRRDEGTMSQKLKLQKTNEK